MCGAPGSAGGAGRGAWWRRVPLRVRARASPALVELLERGGAQPASVSPRPSTSSPIGLHLVVARRVAGAARALYDPFLQTLRESGTSGLVMAGDRGEGQLFPGVHAAAQPPGRGLWVRRGEPVRLVQTALAEPARERVGS